jgi:hypothetical protein
MRSVIKFFTLTYLVSWSLFGAGFWLAKGSLGSGAARFSGGVLFLGVIIPALIALTLTAQTEGRTGIRALLDRVVRFPSGARWYLFAAGYMAAIKLIAAVVHRVATGAWPAFGQENVLVMAMATIISTPIQAGEEIGWRGYALPRLTNCLGLGGATDTFGQSFPVYLAQVTAISIAMAWLYWRTNGSLLMTMLLHAAVNNTKDIVPSVLEGATNPLSFHASLVAWLTVTLLWICAAVFLVQMRAVKEIG